MEYFEFNKEIKSNDQPRLLQAAVSCSLKQQRIKEQIAELNDSLKQQQDFEAKLLAKSRA